MKEIAIFQTDFQVGGVQRSLVNILNKIDYGKCHVDLYIFDEGCFFDMPAHENLRVIQVPPLPRWVRLVYFGLVRAFARDVTGGKPYDVAVDSTATRTTAPWASSRPTPKSGSCGSTTTWRSS